MPAHPRSAAEPTVRSADEPIERDAARVLLLDAADRLLLIAHLPGDGRTVWTAPGGGLDPGETHEQAAERELALFGGSQLVLLVRCLGRVPLFFCSALLPR